MKESRSEYVNFRGLEIHVRHWGNENFSKIFMLHGWMDNSASFQFIVDFLKKDWHVIAPDFRGFGLSEWTKSDCYWFPDYIGDLDFILDFYSKKTSVNLLGHSMGGNVAGIYSGVRPSRVSKLVNLEGFGLPRSHPEEAPKRFEKWLNELKIKQNLKSFNSKNEVISHLIKINPRLKRNRADFIANHWSKQNSNGQWEIMGDPSHKIVSANLYNLEEVLACWKKISAKVLWVEAELSEINKWIGKDIPKKEFDDRKKVIKNVKIEKIRDAGHMLHHEKPQEIAKLLDNFFNQA